MQSLSQYLAAALLNGTRKKFSSLQADYLKEITMSNRYTAGRFLQALAISKGMTPKKLAGV